MSLRDFPVEMEKFLKDFRQEMREMRNALEKELRKEYKELKSSITFFSQQFDAMAKRHTKLEKENAALKKENASLLTECQSLKELATSSEQRITDLEQYSRNKNIEIKGIPFSENESLPQLLKQLGDVITEEITEQDIDACHRVPRRDEGCPNVVVQFRSRAKRDLVIEKSRKKRLSTSDFGHVNHSPVFVNDHLCPTLKILLGQVVARKNEKGWKYAWTRDGKIFARKSDSSRVLRVTRSQDLEKIQ